MNLFKSTTFGWWQLGMFKWGVFGCGLLVGARFSQWVDMFVFPIAFVTFVCVLYITILWLQEHRK